MVHVAVLEETMKLPRVGCAVIARLRCQNVVAVLTDELRGFDLHRRLFLAR